MGRQWSQHRAGSRTLRICTSTVAQNRIRNLQYQTFATTLLFARHTDGALSKSVRELLHGCWKGDSASRAVREGAPAWSSGEYLHLTPLLSFSYTLSATTISGVQCVPRAEQFTKHTATCVRPS